MVKFDNQLNVGAPYVYLTTNNPEPVGGEVDLEDPENLILTLQESNLISCSEKKGTEHGSKPTILLKFLDPEMLFLPRLFGQSAIKLYRTYFNKLKEGNFTAEELKTNAWHEYLNSSVPFGPSPSVVVSQKSDETSPDIKIPGWGSDATRSSGAYEAAPYDLPKEKDELWAGGPKWLQDMALSKIIFYLKYGNGVGVVAPWRKYILAGFFISQDSSDNMAITLQLTEYDAYAAEYKKTMTVDEADGGFLSNFKNISEAEDDISKVFFFSVELFPPNSSATRTTFDFTPAFRNEGRAWPAPPIEKLDIMVSMLENLYQKFLLKNGSADSLLPFVFLSPKITPKLNKKIDERVELYKNSGSYKTGRDPVLIRLEILRSILYDCGITLVSKSHEKITEDKGGFTGLGTLPVRNFLSYYIALPWENTVEVPKYEDVVINSMTKLYTLLGIDEGGYPTDLNKTEPINISNPIHQRLFIKQFCEQDTGSGVYTNNYDINTGTNQDPSPGPRSPANTYHQQNDETTQENNIPAVTDDTLTNYEIKVFTDYIIGHGLIMPIVPGQSDKVLDLYVKRIRGAFGEGGGAKSGNVFKFLNGDSTLQTVRDYIIGVEAIFFPDINTSQFDYGADEDLLKSLGATPIFVSNRNLKEFGGEHLASNVLEVISSERKTGFGIILRMFDIIKKGGAKNLKDILNTDLSARPEFNDAEFDRSIDNVIRKSYKNNVPLHTLLLALADFPDNIDGPALAFFEQLRKETKDHVVNSPNMEGKEVDYAGITAHLNYIQRLSNHIATVAIKTIPFFNLVDPIILGKPCLFLNNTSFHALTRGVAPKGFLSGVYMIVNYEHNISNGECYSKFDIVRQEVATRALSLLGDEEII